MKKIISFGLTALIITVLFSSCKKENPIPPDQQPQIMLTLDEVSCTEIWIKLTVINILLPAEIEFYQDSILNQKISLINTDSILYVDSLKPDRSYNFLAVFKSNSQIINETSNQIEVMTGDTTTHSFTDQSWEFGGQMGSCSLYDVSIINNNSIWAVGSIFLSDGLGGEELKNAVHWDGNEWIMETIEVDFLGYNAVFPLTGVVAFSDSNIWFIGSLPIHGDGKNWTVYDLRSMLDPSISVSRGWGKSSDDIYFVGEKGSIVHYKDGNWYKLESGTVDIIADVWGVSDEEGKWNIYCNTFDKLLRINDSDKITPIQTPSNVFLSSLWSTNIHLLYTAGEGINLYRNDEWIKLNDVLTNSIRIAKGFNYNEILGLGSVGSIFHFNGYSWQKIYMNPDNTYYYLSVSKEIVVAVGWKGEKALITSMKRI